jgi:hypothetical protein
VDFRLGHNLSQAGRRVDGDWDDAEVDRAPICPYCGVTALPADPANVIDSRFVCENPDCDSFGELVDG